MCGCKLLNPQGLQGIVRVLSVTWRANVQVAEQLTQAAETPEIATPSESTPIKKQRRGKRPGAGRKPNLSKRLLKGFSREAIAAAVADVDCGQVITGLLKSKRERTRLEALVYI